MAAKEFVVGQRKYVVRGQIGTGGTSFVVQASTEGGINVALRIYHPFDASVAVQMSDKISKEATLMIDWDSPWVVKGIALVLPTDPVSNTITAMEFNAETLDREMHRRSFHTS
jgi:signal recognition particle receptor subunit beta